MPVCAIGHALPVSVSARKRFISESFMFAETKLI
jgi:hypothetical protein